jgi:hypothetical protein
LMQKALFKCDKPIGAAPQGHFFVGGGGGVWTKKVVTLRGGLRISEKKEILRKPTVLEVYFLIESKLCTIQYCNITIPYCNIVLYCTILR